MNVAIEVHHDTFRRESLGAVAGDSVAVSKCRIFVSVEADGFTGVHLTVSWPSLSICCTVPRSRLATPNSLDGA